MSKAKLSNIVKVRLTDAQAKRLEELSMELGKDRSDIMRDALFRYSSRMTKSEIKRIVALARSLPDPFGEVVDEDAKAKFMLLSVDQGDMDLAGEQPCPNFADLQAEYSRQVAEPLTTQLYQQRRQQQKADAIRSAAEQRGLWVLHYIARNNPDKAYECAVAAFHLAGKAVDLGAQPDPVW